MLSLGQGEQQWDISAIVDPLERQVWNAKYEVYCEAYPQQKDNGVIVCCDEDVLKTLEEQGVEFQLMMFC